jgi:hypothetical protein
MKISKAQLKQIIKEEIKSISEDENDLSKEQFLRIMKSSFEAANNRKDRQALEYFTKEFRRLESEDSMNLRHEIENILSDYGYKVDFTTLKVS